MVMTTPGGSAVAAAVTTLSLVVALTVLAEPLAVRAQPTGKVYRIGVLSGASAGSAPLEAFRQGLRELGWVEGQNIVVEYRFAEDRLDRLPDLAAGVAFYGSAPDVADVPKIKAPLLILSAEVDERINASWPAFEAALKDAHVPYERHLYPGTQHGFHNDTTPRYDEAAAKEAWQRTLDWFNKYLRG